MPNMVKISQFAKSSNRSQLQFESRARPSRFSPPTWTGAGQNKNRNEKAKNQVLGGGTILKDLEITFKAFFFLVWNSKLKAISVNHTLDATIRISSFTTGLFKKYWRGLPFFCYPVFFVVCCECFSKKSSAKYNQRRRRWVNDYVISSTHLFFLQIFWKWKD